MCQSKADGGQRCYPHTAERVRAAEARVLAAILPDDRDKALEGLHAAQVELASTKRGESELREQAESYPDGSAERDVLNSVIARGVELRERNAAVRDAMKDVAETKAEKDAREALEARLPSMTPNAIDTDLAGVWSEIYRTEDRLAAARRDLDYMRRRRFAREEDEQRAQESIAKYEKQLEKLRRSTEPYEAEFRRRGGWSRFYETTGPGSHIHASMNCDSCYPTTRYTWHPDMSGKTEDEAVGEWGKKMCSYDCCFPSAPTDPRYQELGRRDREAVDARAAERAQRAAAKAAKAITRPDGTALKDDHGDTINTLVTARNRLVGVQAYQAHLLKYADQREAEGDPGHAANLRQMAAQRDRVVDDIEQAIAAKTGQSVEEVRAEAAPKIARKVRKGEW